MVSFRNFATRFWDRSDRRYLLLGVLIGSLYVVCVPPFQTPDEPNHFYRCYQICSGRLISEKRGDWCGGTIPSGVVEDVESSSGSATLNQGGRLSVHAIISLIEEQPPRKEKAEFVNFPNSALYSPIPYLPQALGVLPAKLLRLPPLLLMYAGRFTNLLVTLVICAYAIRITPIFGGVAFLIALTPMFVYEAASLSPDAATNALSILLAALILKCAFKRVTPLEGSNAPYPTVARKDLLLIAVLALLLGFCKSAYCLVPLLYFVIPQERVGGWKKYYVLGAAIFTLSLAASILWLGYIKPIYVPYLPGGWPDLSQPRFFIEAHPFVYSKMLIRNLLGYSRFYAISFVGYLGWLDTKLPTSLTLGYLAILCGAALLGGDFQTQMTARSRLVVGLVAVAGCALVVTGQFFIWTEAGSLRIRAAQGRHFIPYALPSFLLLYNRRFSSKISAKLFAVAVWLTPVIALSAALLVIIRRYYGQ
ncbi:MAG TPA: DUF2142 domain-containing protein [Blastocatellia bacterium]|nr:DUF2142 domain-containing protein [Blastocatellia bacterium]